MTFKDELIEAMAQAYYDWCVLNTDEPDEQSRWDDIGTHQNFARSRAEVMLDAALAFRRSEVCGTCGGLGHMYQCDDPADHSVPCPADCIDGRVALPTPRLAVVGEQVGQQLGSGDLTPSLEPRDRAQPVHILAPDDTEASP